MSDLAVSKTPRLERRRNSSSTRTIDADKLLLPRGTFLFVGGDTTITSPDYGTSPIVSEPFWGKLTTSKTKLEA